MIGLFPADLSGSCSRCQGGELLRDTRHHNSTQTVRVRPGSGRFVLRNRSDKRSKTRKNLKIIALYSTSLNEAIGRDALKGMSVSDGLVPGLATNICFGEL